jgi:hypothetical protein
MIPLFEPVLLPLPLWLLAGLAFDVARRTGMGHRPVLAAVVLLRALLALLASVAMLGWVDRSKLPLLGLLVVGTTITCVSALAASVFAMGRERRTHPSPSDGAPGSGWAIARAWWWLAAMDLAALLPALVFPDRRAWLLGILVLLGIPFGFALAMRRLACALGGKRALFARVISMLSAVLPFLFVIALSARQIEATFILVAGFYAIALLVPLCSLCLEGLRTPLVVVRTDSPEATLGDFARLRRRALFLFGLAIASLAWGCLQHLDRCAGELVKVDRPPNHWQSLPIIAELFGSGRARLGPFQLRGYTLHRCGYRWQSIVHHSRHDLRETALHDPDLCFSGTVSLEDAFRTWGWDNLALRYDPASDVYVVSGIERGRNSVGGQRAPSGEEPMLTFRRDLGPRWRFDLPSSAWFIAATVLFLAAGAGLGWRARRRARRDASMGRAVNLATWQLRLLLLSAALPLALEAYRPLYDVPSPGNEMRTRPSLVE